MAVGLNLAPETRNTFRRDLRILFSFCVTRHYWPSNPANNAAKAKEVNGEIGILTVEQPTRLLESSSREVLQYFAIGACRAACR